MVTSQRIRPFRRVQSTQACCRGKLVLLQCFLAGLGRNSGLERVWNSVVVSWNDVQCRAAREIAAAGGKMVKTWTSVMPAVSAGLMVARPAGHMPPAARPAPAITASDSHQKLVDIDVLVCCGRVLDSCVVVWGLLGGLGCAGQGGSCRLAGGWQHAAITQTGTWLVFLVILCASVMDG